MSESTPQERRKHSRITFNVPATLSIGGQKHEVAILDLSLKGALVQLRTAETVADQALCTLRIQLNEPLVEVIMKARVVRVTESCVGLLCMAMDLDSVTHLRHIVEFNLGSPALLERELSLLIGPES